MIRYYTCFIFVLHLATACLAQSVQYTIDRYIVTTSEGQRFRQHESPVFKELPQPVESQPAIFIDPSHRFQNFLGIGGALTDASAETFALLSPALQNKLLVAYYDTLEGIGYSIARTNMNSCDFSSDTYTYVEENDKSLKSFSISHDEKYKLPMISSMLKTAQRKIRLYVSPWSPPAWMKDNNNMIQGGSLKKEYFQAWADYYVRYIHALEKKNIPVWGLSVQNEPMAKQRWESCIYTAEQERDFIKNFLGPTLHRNGLKDKKLIAWDHNRDLVYHRASVILNDPAAAKYVWGIGYHWYETWTGSAMQFGNVGLVARAFPSVNLIFTEGCKEKFNMDSIHNWSLGEKYGYSLINDFNQGTCAWTDWNVLLDAKGGPNHVGNFCFAPVHTSAGLDSLIFTSAYYYIGHFSKYIVPGARRIAASSSRDQLLTTAFLNPDNSITVVVMNASSVPAQYKLWMNGKAADIKADAHSISTMILMKK